MLRLGALEADVRNLDLAGAISAGTDDETDLEAVHRHGHVRVDGCAPNFARRRIDARGDVDRDDGTLERVDALDQRASILARLAVEAGPEQRIDDDVGVITQLLRRLATGFGK
jgi:hypothetical protein